MVFDSGELNLFGPVGLLSTVRRTILGSVQRIMNNDQTTIIVISVSWWILSYECIKHVLMSYCLPILRARYSLLVDVSPSVVCPSGDHISKTKLCTCIYNGTQYRSLHHWFCRPVQILPSPPPAGEMFLFQMLKIMLKHQYVLVFDFGVRPQMLSTERDRRLTGRVVDRVRPSGPVVNTHRCVDAARPVVWRESWTGGGPWFFLSQYSCYNSIEG